MSAETDALLSAIRVLEEPAAPGTMLGSVLAELASVLAIDGAMVLRMRSDGQMEAVASTHQAWLRSRWSVERLFRGVLGGVSQACGTLRGLAEWEEQPPQVQEGVGSIVLMSFKSVPFNLLLMLVHRTPGYYNEVHLARAERLRPVFSALLRAIGAHGGSREVGSVNRSAAYAFADQYPAPLLRVHRNGALMYGNRASGDLLEALMVLPGDHLPEGLHHIPAEVLREGEARVMELNITGRSIELTFVPQPGADAVFAYGRDLTHIRAERLAAAETDRRLRALVRQLDVGVLVEDAQGQIVHVNAALLRILGISQPADALVGHAAIDLTEQAASVLADPRAFARSTAHIVRERSFEAGEELRLRNGGICLRDAVPILVDERYRGIVWLYRDISEQKRSARAVREFEANLLALIENSEDMFWSVGQDLRFIAFNGAFAQNMRTNVGFEPAVGMHATEPLPGDQARHWMALYRHALAGNRLAAEDAVPGDDGPHYYEMTLSPIITDGAVTGVAVHSRDVTEQRAQAAILERAKEQAESANRAKSDFLANMSHEIRTPLNAIIGMGELALWTELNAVQTEYLRTICSNSESLLNLINEILDFSKIEAGQMELDPRPFSVRELIEDVVVGQAERAFTKGLDLSLAIRPSLPARLVGDARHVRQVLTNLVSNAIKYTPRGRVAVRAFDLPSRRDRLCTLVLEVSDTGVGIAQADLERVFEKFNRGSAEGRAQVGGTGLGLSITRSLIELMGGEIRLRSEPGVGSTFRVELDLEVDAREQGDALKLREILGGLRVLLWIADAGERGALAELLAQFDVEVMEGQRAEDVAAFAAQRPPDATVLDGRLGAEFLQSAVAGSDLGALLLLRAPGSDELFGAPLAHCFARLGLPLRGEDLIGALLRLRGVKQVRDGGEAEHADQRLEHVGVRILLVEDNPDNQAVAMAILRQSGYEVDLARDGVEAVEMARTGGYDLALMDVHMPRMDGLEATEHIREEEQALGRERLPIVMLTAHATEDYRFRAMSAGADDFLTKPVAPARLLRTIAERARRGAAVLIVDDVASNRQLLGHYLAPERAYRLLFAADGREALRIAQLTPVSLVLLDMEMPVLDGLSTARALHAIPGLEGVPIVAITGHAEDSARAASQEAGCAAHLVKPIRRVELLELVRRLLVAPPEVEPQGSRLVEAQPGELEEPDISESGTETLAAAHQAALPVYLDQVRQALAGVRALLVAGEFATLADQASMLRQEAREMGLRELPRVLRELQRAADREDAERVKRAVRDLLTQLEALRVEWV